MAKIEYGLQLYSLYDITDKDLKGALQKVSEMGYKDVQFAGYFGHSAEEIKGWLDEFGLVSTSAHVGFSDSDEAIDATIAFHKTLGCGKLIVAGINVETQEALDAGIALLNKVQGKLEAVGMRLGYHNHSKEFVHSPYGKIAEEEIAARTRCELEIDTFWVYNAGLDPIEVLERYKDRIRMIHIKDGIPSPAPCTQFATIHNNTRHMALGEGNAPVLAVRDWCLKNNVQMVVESEGLNPSGLEEVKRCIDFLRSLE